MGQSNAEFGQAFVDVAFTARQTGARKPEAQDYQAIAAALEVAPAECLFFDNQPFCIEGARQVRMHAYLVDRSRSEHDLDNSLVCELSALDAILNRHQAKG